MELALKRAIASPVSQPRPKLPPTRPRSELSFVICPVVICQKSVKVGILPF